MRRTVSARAPITPPHASQRIFSEMIDSEAAYIRHLALFLRYCSSKSPIEFGAMEKLEEFAAEVRKMLEFHRFWSLHVAMWELQIRTFRLSGLERANVRVGRQRDGESAIGMIFLHYIEFLRSHVTFVAKIHRFYSELCRDRALFAHLWATSFEHFTTLSPR